VKIHRSERFENQVIISINLSDVIISKNFEKPTPIPLKFILDQCCEKACDPIVISLENVLIEGIWQYKVAKLLKWTTIPAIIQEYEKGCSRS